MITTNATAMTYTAPTLPTLGASGPIFLQKQLNEIANAINNISALTPQPATKAPAAPVDGMIRLARSPWRPLNGQTADTWVYYDATLPGWVAL